MTEVVDDEGPHSTAAGLQTDPAVSDEGKEEDTTPNEETGNRLGQDRISTPPPGKIYEGHQGTEVERAENGKESETDSERNRQRHPNESTSQEDPSTHGRSPSLQSNSSKASTNVLSLMAMIATSLKNILSTKDGRRKGPLHDTCERAIQAIEDSKPNLPPPELVFEPLAQVCACKTATSVVIALDCLSRLLSHSYLVSEQASAPHSPASMVPERRAGAPKRPLIDRAIDVICNCFDGENTDERIQLQIIKALVSAVLNERVLVHDASLLKAIRMIYNLFLFSRNPSTQALAQGTLTQMLNTIFDRVKVRLPPTEQDQLSSHLNNSTRAVEKVTLESFEKKQSFEEERPNLGDENGATNEAELFVKDAYLVFRTLCKLADKKVGEFDMRSQQMRSKLLSLHLIHTILKTHIIIFTSPDISIRSNRQGADPVLFIEAVKQYLVVALSRNGTSPFISVFAIASDIFYIIISSMRNLMKKEIELFLHEQYLPLLEMHNSTSEQKNILLGVFLKLFNEPKAVVELYLNYDCDASALDNIFERLMNDLSNLVKTRVVLTSLQKEHYIAQKDSPLSPKLPQGSFDLPPSLSTSAVSNSKDDTPTQVPVEVYLKRNALECVVAMLRSLVIWSQQGIAQAQASLEQQTNGTTSPEGEISRVSRVSTPRPADRKLANDEGSKVFVDDPSEFESIKQRKTLLMDGIRNFNFKPSRGIKVLISNGFIESEDPKEIADFLLKTDGLNKAVIGEYLGGGEPSDIAVMHAFVDGMDFSHSGFVSSLRHFLQSFRLPGEAQKIDRLMLKFAERYVVCNPGSFANADTAYILAYSVILLNTDQHSPQIRKRMTLQDFIRNNGGINEGRNLPDDYLEIIYNEIQGNEIILKSEQDLANTLPAVQHSQGIAAGIGAAFATLGRDIPREAYMQVSEEMATKTEALFKDLMRAQKKGPLKNTAKYYNASHVEHVGPMFEAAWMPILAGLSGTMQEADEDSNLVDLCVEGFRLAVRISCMFDLDLARNAYVSSLAKFTYLNNLGEMKSKNVEAVKVLLDVALNEGNQLKNNWKEVLTCVSQLERLQLLSLGVDEATVPDVTRARRQGESLERPRTSLQFSRRSRNSSLTTNFSKDVGKLSHSREIIIASDKVFSQSASLNGEGIVYFVRALSEISWDEIQSSGNNEQPRTFSLQKLVDTSYYNMGRIRVEWSQLWMILGEHFTQVGCHTNTSVVFFAIDSLRQLSMRFLEIEELPHFRFQKDFLKPFEFIFGNNPDVAVRDMILRCVNQMVQARAGNLKSGWRTMFGVYSLAANDPQDSIVTFNFDAVRAISSKHLASVIRQGNYRELVICLSTTAKNRRLQKTSLQAVDCLKRTISKMIETMQSGEEKIDGSDNLALGHPFMQTWFPILYGFHDIIMNGEDLEVRSRALNYLFETLTLYGGTFSPDFWDTVCRNLLFPIFTILKSRHEGSRMNHEEMSVWLSTTMIQALRNLISLLTHYFSTLGRMLDGFLELLIACICQENDTLARIGSSCFQQLILQNIDKLEKQHWKMIVDALVKLFETTTAHALFTTNTAGATPVEEVEITLNIEDGDKSHGTPRLDLQEGPATRKKEFKQLIVKCVLQLLMIDTVAELFGSDEVYVAIPSEELLALMQTLRRSFEFAKKFNNDRELRMRLWKIGFMKQLPNLLKQETSSAATYINILLRMYIDEAPDRVSSKKDIERALFPLCDEIVSSYVELEVESQARNISAWRPVVVEMLVGYSHFHDEDVRSLFFSSD